MQEYYNSSTREIPTGTAHGSPSSITPRTERWNRKKPNNMLMLATAPITMPNSTEALSYPLFHSSRIPLSGRLAPGG